MYGVLSNSIQPGDGLGALRIGDQRYARAVNYRYGARFTTSIAAGGSFTKSFNIEAGLDFLVEKILASVRLAAAADAAVAGTPLPPMGDNKDGTGDNDLPTLHLIDVEISDGSQKWSNTPIPLALLAGDAGDPSYQLTKQLIEGNTNVEIKLTNNSAHAVVADVFFAGAKLYRR